MCVCMSACLCVCMYSYIVYVWIMLQPVTLLFLPVMLCCSARKFDLLTYYAQEQEFCSVCYNMYMQVCIKPLYSYGAEKFRKNVLLEYIYKWYQIYSVVR